MFNKIKIVNNRKVLGYISVISSFSVMVTKIVLISLEKNYMEHTQLPFYVNPIIVLIYGISLF